MLLQLLNGGGYERDAEWVGDIVTNHGQGFSRPAGDADLATVIAQVYEFMRDNLVQFPFNGHLYYFTYWELFITSIVFWLLVDIICMGWRVINRNQIVYDSNWY